MLFARFTESPKPVVGVVPDRRVFSGETVTLTCDIQQTGDWQYSWYKDGNQVQCAGQNDQNYIIPSVVLSHGGVYKCLEAQSCHSQFSDEVTLTVSGKSSCVFTQNPSFLLTVLSAVFSFSYNGFFCLETEK